ncbi:hypothetical protein KNE206_25790 [Kitasatospora sp. NE20-6]
MLPTDPLLPDAFEQLPYLPRVGHHGGVNGLGRGQRGPLHLVQWVVRQSPCLDGEAECVVDLGVVALVFRCHPVGGAPRVSDEPAAVQWLPADEAVARMGDMYAIRVRDALNTGDPAVRAHDGRQLVA